MILNFFLSKIDFSGIFTVKLRFSIIFELHFSIESINDFQLIFQLFFLSNYDSQLFFSSVNYQFSIVVSVKNRFYSDFFCQITILNYFFGQLSICLSIKNCFFSEFLYDITIFIIFFSVRNRLLVSNSDSQLFFVNYRLSIVYSVKNLYSMIFSVELRF